MTKEEPDPKAKLALILFILLLTLCALCILIYNPEMKLYRVPDLTNGITPSRLSYKSGPP